VTEDVFSEARHYAVLVAGSGSIGRRHMRNLRSLGIQQIAVADPDPEQLEPMVAELGVTGYSDLSEALKEVRPDVVFVCSPPVFHVPQALDALAAGAHVFIEKPLSDSYERVDDLITEARRAERVVQVGYNLRFHPGYQRLARLVEEGAAGRILWASAEVGQYLPDWRPWQDYRHSYTARRELGGGIILDASHELDYLIGLLGRPTEIACMAGTVSDLDVDVEDCATILLRFPGRVLADVHMDFVQRSYSRSCKVVGEKGTIIWDFAAGKVRVFRSESEGWEILPVPCGPNDTYVEEVRHFLKCVAESGEPIVNLEQAAAVLKAALAAKAAARNGRVELLS
jgi:predicted dehydrogenase